MRYGTSRTQRFLVRVELSMQQQTRVIDPVLIACISIVYCPFFMALCIKVDIRNFIVGLDFKIMNSASVPGTFARSSLSAINN